jgi:hypothetical protein
MDARIILAGQPVNALASLGQGMALGQQRQEWQRQNALAQFVQANGAGLMSGDPAALAGYAAYDPQAALGIQSARQAMTLAEAANARAIAADGRASQAQDWAAQDQAWQGEDRSVATATRLQAEEQAKLDRGLSELAVLRARGDRAAFDAAAAANDVPPEMELWDNFDAITARVSPTAYAAYTSLIPAPVQPELVERDDGSILAVTPTGATPVPGAEALGPEWVPLTPVEAEAQGYASGQRNTRSGEIKGDVPLAQTITGAQLAQMYPGMNIDPTALFRADNEGNLTRVDAAPAAPADEYGRYVQEQTAAGRRPLSRIEYEQATSAQGTTVNNNVGAGETAFQKATGEALAEEAAGVAQQGAVAQRQLGQLTTLESALANSPQGAAGRLGQIAAGLGISFEGRSDLELAQSIISQMVPNQRPPGSGTMSDADLALYAASLPDIARTPDGNRQIIGTLRAIAEYDVARGQIASDLQTGAIDIVEARRRYASLGNPIPASLRAGSTQGAATAAPAPAPAPAAAPAPATTGAGRFATMTASQINGEFQAGTLTPAERAQATARLQAIIAERNGG